MNENKNKTTADKISELEAKIKNKKDAIKKSQDNIRNEEKILAQLRRELEYADALSLKRWFDDLGKGRDEIECAIEYFDWFTTLDCGKEKVQTAIQFLNWGMNTKVADGRTFYEVFLNENQVQESEILT